MKSYWYIISLFFATACAPKVLTFSVEPTRVGPGDSVHLQWQTRGTASMTFHSKKTYVPPDSVETWEYILTASRGTRVSAPAIRQVVVDAKRDLLALSLSGIEGDSLVYSAQKDIAFAAYSVTTLAVQKGDPVTARHSGQICILTLGVVSTCMQGLPYAGDWTIKMKMTAAESADHHLIPGDYFLLATITPK